MDLAQRRLAVVEKRLLALGGIPAMTPEEVETVTDMWDDDRVDALARTEADRLALLDRMLAEQQTTRPRRRQVDRDELDRETRRRRG
jgi:hypothetical protein